MEQTVRANQEDWLHRQYEADDQFTWVRNNAAAISYAGAYRDLILLLKDLPEMEKKDEK